jgi:hypothetical protein
MVPGRTAKCCTMLYSGRIGPHERYYNAVCIIHEGMESAKGSIMYGMNDLSASHACTMDKRLKAGKEEAEAEEERGRQGLIQSGSR